jgi:hypothetical protein
MINALRLCLALAAGATASKVTNLAPQITPAQTKALENRLQQLATQLALCKSEGCDRSTIGELRRYISGDVDKNQPPETFYKAKRLLEDASELELKLLAQDLDFCTKNPPYERWAPAVWEHPRVGCLQYVRERSIQALKAIVKDPNTLDNQRNQAEQLLDKIRALDAKYTKERGL